MNVRGQAVDLLDIDDDFQRTQAILNLFDNWIQFYYIWGSLQNITTHNSVGYVCEHRLHCKIAMNRILC
jgi:hypothetical protein